MVTSSATPLRLLSYGSAFLALSHNLVAAQSISAKGCYSSAGNMENEGTAQYQSNSVCQTKCVGLGKPVMALTKGSTCYCGDLLPSESDQTDSSACSTPCFGFGQQSCGGDSAFNVYLTGTQATVGSVGSDGSDSDSSSSSAPPPSSSTPIESTSYSSAPQSVYTPPSTSSTTSTTSTSTSVSATTKIKSTVVSASPSYITLGGSTIVRTVGSEPTSNDSQSSPSASSSSSSSGLSTGGKVGIAIGVIGGVIALAAIIGAVVVYLKRNNKDGVTGRHRRNTSTNGFVASGVAPAGSIASDNRLDTTMVENRRRSGESVFADNEDYSRRILKVVNNPGED